MSNEFLNKTLGWNTIAGTANYVMGIKYLLTLNTTLKKGAILVSTTNLPASWDLLVVGKIKDITTHWNTIHKPDLQH